MQRGDAVGIERVGEGDMFLMMEEMEMLVRMEMLLGMER